MLAMKVSLLSALLFVLLSLSRSELPQCKNGVQTVQFCQVTEKYPITPLIVKPWLEINKVMDVNEDAKSIKVNFHLMLRWNDTGVIVLTPQNET